MKNKIKIIAIAILILTLLIWVIFFGGEKKTDEKKLVEEREKITDDLTFERIKNVTRIEEEEVDPSEGTGAIYISPTRDEFDEIMAIRKIKDESPIETEELKVYFSYASNLIVVEFVNKENEFNMDSFEDWKWDEGYGVIGDEYWDIKL